MPSNMKLKKACTLALKEYMGLEEVETLLVITDENMTEIGHALYESGLKLCGEAFYVEMLSRAANGEEPPLQVSEMMKNVDVVVCPTTKSLSHTNAVRNATRLGIRVATMTGVTVDTMARCLNSDHTKVIETTEKVAELFKGAVEVVVTTKLGTNLSMIIEDRPIHQTTGVMRNIGEYGNLPSGHVSIAPIEDETNGTLILDGSLDILGRVENPVYMDIENGLATKISGKAGEARTFARILNKLGDDGKIIGEFGVGTNYKAESSGEIIEEEKVLGAVHFGFGNNLSLGGKITVPIHNSSVIRNATVTVDGKTIIKNGKLILK